MIHWFTEPAVFSKCCSCSGVLPQRRFAYSCEVVAKSYPIRIVIQFSRCNEKTFHLSPLGSAELSGVFEKISLFCKRPLHSFGQRVLKCTPIFEIFRENFLFGEKISSLIWNCKAKWHPISQKKWENIFWVAGALVCLPKKPLHLFPLRTAECTPWISKKFYPFTYLELGSQNATCFSEKRQKNFACQYRQA